jgi:TRAP transporter TAXI family solute receptor
MTWRRSIIAVIAVACLLTVWTASPTRAQELISFITPPAGGGAYLTGAGIVTVTNKYLPDVKLVHEAASGTMDIVRRMIQKEATKKDAFGIFGSVDAWRAYKGEGEYAAKPFTNLRAVVFNMGTDLYFVVPGNSPIKSYADAKGKRIAMGGPGSTVANTAHFLLEQHGVQKKDFKPYYFTYKETVEGFQDGSLDGGFLAGGFPIASYSELSSRNSVRIVPIDDKMLKKITGEHAYYYATVVKAGAYKGLEHDTPILGFATAVWTHALVSNEIVYKILKNLFDHRQDYYQIHVAAKDMQPDVATKGITVPFHPGAEKYLKEQGWFKK